MENISHHLKADEPNGLAPALRSRLIAAAPGDADSPAELAAVPFWRTRGLQLCIGGAITAVVAIILFPVFAQSRQYARKGAEFAGVPPPASDFRMSQGANRSLESPTKTGPRSGSHAPVIGSSGGETFAIPSDPPGAPPASLRWHSGTDSMEQMNKERQPFRGSTLPDLTGRQVVREATISLNVVKLEEKSESVERMVKELGGFVASNQLSTGQEGLRTAALTVRVPVQKFDDFLRDVSRMGEVTGKNVTGEDITEKVSDEKQGATVLWQELNDVRARLRKGRTWHDEETERQLKIRIAQVEGRLELMRKLAALAKVEITLTEKPKTAIKSGGFLSEMSDTGRAAVNSFFNAARIPVLLLIWAVAYAPIWIPLAIGYRHVSRAYRKRLAVREAREWRSQRA